MKDADKLHKYIRDAHLKIVSESIETFGKDFDDIGYTLANAQAEALVETIINVSMHLIPKKHHAHYINWLFGRMIEVISQTHPQIVGSVVVMERRYEG